MEMPPCCCCTNIIVTISPKLIPGSHCFCCIPNINSNWNYPLIPGSHYHFCILPNITNNWRNLTLGRMSRSHHQTRIWSLPMQNWTFARLSHQAWNSLVWGWIILSLSKIWDHMCMWSLKLTLLLLQIHRFWSHVHPYILRTSYNIHIWSYIFS